MKTNDKILKAAIKVFAKTGYESTSVDLIAETAHFAKGTIYYHYKSKEEIFFAIVRRGLGNYLNILKTKLSESDDPRKQIETILYEQLTYYEKEKEFCRVCYAELWRIESRWQKDIRSYQAEYYQLMNDLITRGKKDGVFKEDLDIEPMTIALFGLLSICGISWTVFHKEITKERMHKTLVEVYLTGILK